MRLHGSTLNLSASDLVGHLNCRHLTELDIAVAKGALAKPSVWDPVLELLAERGAQHERGYIDHLRTCGLDIVAVEGIGIDPTTLTQTREAMRAGVTIIVQGALQSGRWSGRADVLKRIECPSALGVWSYVIIDTKLAQETKGDTVLQLCLYSDLLAGEQGLAPEFAYVVTPGTGFEPQEFRLADYAAYFRRVKKSLELTVSGEGRLPASYPEPIAHCDICRWRTRCETRRRQDDHLSLVAGISKLQVDELGRHGVTTMKALGALPLPLPWKPERGAIQSYEKIREQARLQVQGRTLGEVIYEALPSVPGFGLACLPSPSPGDIFLDFEGDPFVDEGGLEFLFGYVFADDAGNLHYTADWALTREHEKAGFERFMDFAMGRLERDPGLHVYHYAPYEPAALKRLMGRYATRENELDRLLRAGVFVDLYAVVRHGIRASVESYSIKKLEPLYEFARTLPLGDAGRTLAKVQACLELDDVQSIAESDRVDVEGYNRDDCISTRRLRDWLETVRAELIVRGATIDRPIAKPGEPNEDLSEWQQKVAELSGRLMHDIPTDPEQRTPEQQARWLLANLLDWHRREQKALWWEYFRLSDLSAEELLEERAALSGLAFVGPVSGGTAKAPIHRYVYPPQETDIRGDEDLRMLGGDRLGKVISVSLEDRTIDIKKRQDTASVHPKAIFAHQVIDTEVLAEALFRTGEYVATNGIEGDGPYQAARDILLRIGPRTSGQPLKDAHETTLEAAVRIAPHLSGGTFPIQGPPGAGKTHTGARMVCTLKQATQTIGITANSHKVIRNMLDGVIERADECNIPIRCIQKVGEKESNIPALDFTTDNKTLLEAIGPNYQVAAGTAWLWARPDAAQVVDVLFIDEAAQMSLANVLAVSHAARTVVLLGDPRQLEQPIQGSHPEGTAVSALDHILGVHATIPDDRGLFLEQTWRLHPEICAFTSEVFYESRLRPRPGLEQQRINSTGRIKGFGLRYLPVSHEGNQSSSPEEAEKVRELVKEILGSGATWTDRDGQDSIITLADILIIAPYNAQVFELQDRLPGARIGTVDKFQGQEAPIVIYSMTTSSYADAPRGMEFLYSPNRLNVATSRAKAICVLVGSPQVFEAECRTPRQMQLANAFCRYLEMAAVI